MKEWVVILGKAFVSTSIVMVVFLLGLFALLHYYVHPLSFGEVVEYSTYKMSANWEAKNSHLINDTVNFCGVLGSGPDVVECVVQRIGRQYDYNKTRVNVSTFDILLADQFNETGYICRDIAVAYHAAFKRLGFISEFQYSNKHIYNHVWDLNGTNCEVNMRHVLCW